MMHKIDSIYDLGVLEGEERGEERRLRNMLEQCITLRFPRIARSVVDEVLSITDVDMLRSIFNVACASDSLEGFQRGVRAIAPIV